MDEIPPVSPTNEIPPVSPTNEIPPVSPTNEIPPVSPTTEIPPVSPTTEIPPDSPTNEIPPGFYDEFYMERKELSEGGFAVVKKCKHSLDGHKYAIKIIPYSNKTESDTLKECIILAYLDHPNIVRYHHSWTEIGVPRFFKSELEFTPMKTLFITTECLKKNLKEILEGPFSTDMLDDIFIGMLEGLSYLKHTKIIHGDICPENILFDSSGTPKFIDFGAAEILLDEEDNFIDKDRDGNFFYFAPEVRQYGLYSSASDIFSTAFSIMDAIYPLLVIGPEKFYEDASEGKYPEKDARCSDATHAHLCSMLSKKASFRPSVEQILEDMQH